jgi:predicted nucleotidyltransferase
MAVPLLERTMDRSTLVTLLTAHLPDLQTRYGVTHIALFGSGARDELRTDSDVDVLVEFEGHATYDRYFSLRDHLERIFGRKVDLVTEKGLKPRARRHVEKDIIRVA